MGDLFRSSHLTDELAACCNLCELPLYRKRCMAARFAGLLPAKSGLWLSKAAGWWLAKRRFHFLIMRPPRLSMGLLWVPVPWPILEERSQVACLDCEHAGPRGRCSSSSGYDPRPFLAGASIALAVALAEVKWSVVRNLASPLGRRWPHVDSEPSFGGDIFLEPRDDAAPRGTVWTDRSVGDSGGAAAYQADTGRILQCHVPSPRSSTQCELVALTLVAQFQRRPALVLTDLDWKASSYLFQAPTMASGKCIFRAPPATLKWVAHARAGALATRARLASAGVPGVPSPRCLCCPAVNEDDLHVVAGCPATGAADCAHGNASFLFFPFGRSLAAACRGGFWSSNPLRWNRPHLFMVSHVQRSALLHSARKLRSHCRSGSRGTGF